MAQKYINSVHGLIEEGKVVYLRKEELVEYYHKCLSLLRKLHFKFDRIRLDLNLYTMV